MTVTIQIGNSDDGLCQKRWAEFVDFLMIATLMNSKEIHFSGGPPTRSEYQNFCVVCDVGDDDTKLDLMKAMRQLAGKFSQQSIAWTEGRTSFLVPYVC